MSQKHCQIKSPCLAYSKKSGVFLIPSKTKRVSKGCCLSYKLKDPVIVFGCLCMVINQVCAPDRQVSLRVAEAARLRGNNIKSKYHPESPWAVWLSMVIK